MGKTAIALALTALTIAVCRAFCLAMISARRLGHAVESGLKSSRWPITPHCLP